MQGPGIIHPSDVPPVPVRSGKGSRDSLDIAWKYELLPGVQDFTYPPSVKATNLLRMIWKHFRIATYDCDTSIKTYYAAGSNKETGVKILMQKIHPKDVPGEPMSDRHPRQHPRGEWDRRNWYGLSYGQDMNAIAALTGPVARILAPMGFKVEEVLVHVNPNAMLQQYGFRNHVNPSLAKDVPNHPFLLVFKATWLADKATAYVLAPTGPRFGWNWFALAWDNFVTGYADGVLRVRPLGTTRQVLDDQVVDNYQIPSHVMKVPDRIIRQRQRRDARLKLRRLLNSLNDRTKPEHFQDVECYDTFGGTIEDDMRKWAGRWVQNFCRERHERIQAAAKILAHEPWHVARPFKFSAVPPYILTQSQVAERIKTGRIDSAVIPDTENAPAEPTGPAAPSTPEDTIAGSRSYPKLKILEKFNLNPFKKRKARAQHYQPLDNEGPAGPQDQPFSDAAPQESNQPGNFPGFDAYGVTGGFLDYVPEPLPRPVGPTGNEHMIQDAANAVILRRQRDAGEGLEAWYLFHADEKKNLDPRWTKLPPRQAPEAAHTIHPPDTAAGNAPEDPGEGPSRPDEDPDAITPAPPPVPPKDDGDREPQERMLWAHSQYVNWDKYIRHWYFYEIDDEYRRLTELGQVGPNSITIERDLLRIPELGFSVPAPEGPHELA